MSKLPRDLADWDPYWRRRPWGWRVWAVRLFFAIVWAILIIEAGRYYMGLY